MSAITDKLESEIKRVDEFIARMGKAPALSARECALTLAGQAERKKELRLLKHIEEVMGKRSR